MRHAMRRDLRDVRIGRYRRQTINTREHQITGVNDSESYGIGVRTIVGGSWASRPRAHDQGRGAEGRARSGRLSRAAKSVQRRPIELAPSAPVKGTWMTPVIRDPLEVPIEEKVALLLAANEAALKVPKIRFVTSGLQLLREVKTLLTTEGTNITQTFIRVVRFQRDCRRRRRIPEFRRKLSPRGQGWEYVQSLDMPGNAEKWASIAVEKLSAKSVDRGATT